MKICVCFKTVPDLDQVLEGDWRELEQGLDTSYVKKIYNCFDETALEMALRLRDAADDREVQCTAVTVGGGFASLMKGLYAVGYDRVVNIPLEHSEFCPETVASLLSDFIKNEGFDLVFTGKQAGMADSGMVPPLVAETLGWPLVNSAASAKAGLGWLIFEHETTGGQAFVRLRGPAVVSVGDAEYAYLRAATLREKMAASKRSIEEYPASVAPETVMPVFSREVRTKNCQMIDGETIADKAAVLYEDLIREVM